jgi:transposase
MTLSSGIVILAGGLAVPLRTIDLAKPLQHRNQQDEHRCLCDASEQRHAPRAGSDIQDRDGGVLVLSTLFGMYPFLQKLFADGGYQGPVFQKALAKALPHLAIEIVKRSDQAKGFEVLPRRWVVERTFAWFNRCRRLAKDYENLTRNALAFLRLASIRLMLRKLCNQ